MDAEKEKKTTIMLKNEYGHTIVAVNKTGMTIQEVFEELIEPMLLASGYAKESIDKYLDS